jgi:hypothetical protein
MVYEIVVELTSNLCVTDMFHFYYYDIIMARKMYISCTVMSGCECSLPLLSVSTTFWLWYLLVFTTNSYITSVKRSKKVIGVESLFTWGISISYINPLGPPVEHGH